MLKKILVAAVAMQSAAYADINYTKYFYGQSRPPRTVRKAYPAQRYSSPRRIPMNAYRPTNKGLYVEWYGAARIPSPFSTNAEKPSTTNTNNKITHTNTSWFKLPFVIPREKRIGYIDTDRRNNIRTLSAPITKSIFTGPIVGWRFHQYAAVEGNGLLMLPPFSNHTYYNNSSKITERCTYALGAIPSGALKGIWTYQDKEVYGKAGLAFPMALLREKHRKETKEDGPWTLSCRPQVLLSVGGSWLITRELKFDGSLNFLTAISTAEQSKSERRRSRPTSGNVAPRTSSASRLTATWLQAGFSYRIL